ncbi:MAG TPA: PqqD family protein [Blastocatellia bacterium]|nr:PqqD family protein [Blastocatellia bacterium]
MEELKPHARKEGLIVQELADEVLVYDLERHKAHCLNRTAAWIWKQCDGQTTVGQIARRLEQETGRPVDEDVVWLGLEQLGKARLLPQRVTRDGNKVTRRDVMKKVGIAAAVGLPVITSIVAPTAAQAATQFPSGACCTTGADCLSGLCETPASPPCPDGEPGRCA